jgi:cytochrome c oxidase assembly protein subunit 15
MDASVAALEQRRPGGSQHGTAPESISPGHGWPLPNLFLRSLTKFAAFLTFSLLVAGALVTSMKAQLSDPTWPTFVGRPFPTKETFVGGLIFEDSHRILAGFTGLVTLLQGVALSFAPVSRKIKRFGWFAVGLVVAQALVGGLVIHSTRNPYVSVVHGVLGQTYLATMTGLALITSRWWHEAPDYSDLPGLSSMRRQMQAAAWLVFIQLLLGAGLRHSERGFTPHLIFHIAGAVIVAGYVFFLTIRALAQFNGLPFLRRGMVTLSGLIILQMIFGAGAVFANRARPELEVARMHHVVVSVGHVAIGATILVAVVLLTLALRRLTLVNLQTDPTRRPA